MEKKNVKIHSIKKNEVLGFHILSEALNYVPPGPIFYIPKSAETWLKSNCEGNCYLISIDRDVEDQYLLYVLNQYYLGIFDNSTDAVLYKLIWG